MCRGCCAALHRLVFPLSRHLSQCSFLYPCVAVTSTGLISEGSLSGVSWLASVSVLRRRRYVGFPPFHHSRGSSLREAGRTILHRVEAPLNLFLVDRMGVEPTTPCLQGTVAPSVHAGPGKLGASGWDRTSAHRFLCGDQPRDHGSIDPLFCALPLSYRR